MYAAGFGIRPIRSARRGGGLQHGGRWVAVLLLVLATVLALGRAAEGGSAPAAVVVQPGDTLWSIAAARYPADDTRARVAEIERLNGLQSPLIEAGETLRLPG